MSSSKTFTTTLARPRCDRGPANVLFAITGNGGSLDSNSGEPPSCQGKVRSIRAAGGRHGLSWLNFFAAAMQTGFGPFIGVYLTGAGWSQTGIGFALSIGTVTGLLAQLPAGAVIDHSHHKRGLVAASLVMLAISTAMLAGEPTRGWIWGSQVLHALASVAIAPAIATITLALCGHDAYSRWLGVNARFSSMGAASTAALLGGCATYFSPREIFLASTMLSVPALAAIFAIRSAGRVKVEHPVLRRLRERPAQCCDPWTILRDPVLRVFGAAVLLFHVANAAMLSLALNALTANARLTSDFATKGLGVSDSHIGYVVAGAIFVPQIVVAVASPGIGAAAQSWGRRPILLAGFAALPLRGLLFAAMPDGDALLAIQLLDGVSAAVLGLMVPLIAADATRDNGNMTLAISSFGLAAGMGAAVSTTLAGSIADWFGMPAAFLALSAVGALALAVLFVVMPETRQTRGLKTSAAVATVQPDQARSNGGYAAVAFYPKR